ncbi:peroxiredoxin-like family protein [Acuticoccus sediminis]|uniref:peroxiredoxin-like family protein n=1 Tax=Acuticoccus sediminis TaxID=2184697 RepID=UPI001CFCC18A|nr:peroxiredoxin-like family protein [Acuticoccus sediminis]
MGDDYRDELDRARRIGGPLDGRLAIIRNAFRRFRPTYSSAIDRFVERIEATDPASRAPAVGEAMPEFALPDSTGRIVTLRALLEEGPVVVSINRGVWCPLCRTTLAALTETEPAVRAAGARLVSISPQRAAYGEAHRHDAGAEFPMLSDVDLGYATVLGLTVPIGEELAACYDGFAIDLAAINGNEGVLLPIPATFVVGRDGTILARHIDPDPRHRMDPCDVVQALTEADEADAGPSQGEPHS